MESRELDKHFSELPPCPVTAKKSDKRNFTATLKDKQVCRGIARGVAV